MSVQPKLSRLKAKLATAKVRETDQALFEVVNQLISSLTQSQSATAETIGTTTTDLTAIQAEVDAVEADVATLESHTYITETNESADIPNSRRLIAGSDITLDVSVANQMTINSIALDREWSVLTNGDSVSPEVIFADGDVIMVSVP